MISKNCQSNSACLRRHMVDFHLAPSCTMRFSSRNEFNVRAGAVYIYGESVENRSHLPANWMSAQSCHFFRIEEMDYNVSAFRSAGREYRLRSRVDIMAFADRVLDAS